MKNKLNFSQLLLLSRNGLNTLLSDYYDFEELMYVFPSHVQDFYKSSKMEFHLYEPFLSSEFNEQTQASSISLNGIELGELHLYHFSFPDFSSLVYYSSSRTLEMVILDESIYSDYTLNNYLTLIYELTSMWLGEKSLYEKLNQSQQLEK